MKYERENLDYATCESASMVTDEQQQRLRALVTVFLGENAKLNLSALRDEESCYIGNVLDSLPLMDLSQVKHLTEARVLDIGTGGGFPLLPLAICNERWWFTGLDATGKKLDAIRRIADTLDLKNVTLLYGRSEELAHDKRHRERYDIVTARAVAPLATLLELTIPFVKKGGHFVAWKSMHIEDELEESTAARKALGCALIDRVTYELPGDWGKRQLLIFVKSTHTPDEYPRENGIPKQNPLCSKVKQ